MFESMRETQVLCPCCDTIETVQMTGESYDSVTKTLTFFYEGSHDYGAKIKLEIAYEGVSEGAVRKLRSEREGQGNPSKNDVHPRGGFGRNGRVSEGWLQDITFLGQILRLSRDLANTPERGDEEFGGNTDE